MQINKISFLPRANSKFSSNLQQKNSSPKQDRNYNYNPIAYVDYNISFGARLFRTPANFYEQPFNKNGMPDTMKAYLNADYEDRKNMPPAQMLRLVFDDVKYAKTLDQVKRIYPDEPLFNNLTDVPNRKARTGLVSEIETLKEDTSDIPLFKNGNSNFGMYLLKKIYLEGKSLKEINKDFKQDLNPIYSDLIDGEIDYSVPAAYGVKFPNRSFWKSFTATREDFPYVYKPRKVDGNRIAPAVKRELTLHDIKSGDFELPKRPPRYKVSDRELKGFTDAIMSGGANIDAVTKNLKNKGFKNNENASFVQKYFSQIVTVALDKINASDEMRSCFENMTTRKQVDRMNHYWATHPQMRALQAMAMTDTIKLFFDAYGVDGNNQEFKELLIYADSIKPEREAKRIEHDRIQAEYDELFRINDVPENVNAPAEPEPANEPEKKVKPVTREALEEIASQYGAKVYEFETKNGTVAICSDMNEILEDYWRSQTKVLPTAYANGLFKFVKADPRVNESYILTSVLKSQNVEVLDDARLMSVQDAEELDYDLQAEYAKLNSKASRAAEQAVIDAVVQLAPSIGTKIYNAGITDFNRLFSTLSSGANESIKNKKKFIDNKYFEYKRDLTDSESRKLAIVYMDMLAHYDADKSRYAGAENTFAVTLSALSQVFAVDKEARAAFRNELSKYMKDVYGGSARVITDKNVNTLSKLGKLESLLSSFFDANPTLFLNPLCKNFDLVEDYIRENDAHLYQIMTNNDLQELRKLEKNLKEQMELLQNL